MQQIILGVVEHFMCHISYIFYTEGSALQNYRKEIV